MKSYRVIYVFDNAPDDVRMEIFQKELDLPQATNEIMGELYGRFGSVKAELQPNLIAFSIVDMGAVSANE